METTSQLFTISAPLDSLMHLSKDDEYLFFNYKWVESFDNKNRVHLNFDNWQEAAAIHHELRKVHVAGLMKNWN